MLSAPCNKFQAALAYHILIFILVLFKIVGNSPRIVTKGLVIGGVCVAVSFDMVQGPESLLVILPVIVIVRYLSIKVGRKSWHFPKAIPG